MLALTFLGGGVVGAVGGAVWTRETMLAAMRTPEALPDRILPRLRADLGLTPDQAARVEEIVRRRHAALEAVRAEAYPRQVAEFQAMRAEVDAVLTPDQRARWAAVGAGVEQRYLPARPPGPPQADALFLRFDADGDGALTEREVPPAVWHRLRAADRDGDGRVTLREYREARAEVTGAE